MLHEQCISVQIRMFICIIALYIFSWPIRDEKKREKEREREREVLKQLCGSLGELHAFCINCMYTCICVCEIAIYLMLYSSVLPIIARLCSFQGEKSKSEQKRERERRAKVTAMLRVHQLCTLYVMDTLYMYKYKQPIKTVAGLCGTSAKLSTFFTERERGIEIPIQREIFCQLSSQILKYMHTYYVRVSSESLYFV